MSFQIYLFILLTYFATLRIKPRALCMAGKQALYHPDSSPAQNLVLSIRACALLDQAQRSPVLFAHCPEDKQEDAGKGSLDQGQSSRGRASWEEASGSWNGSLSGSSILLKVNWVGEDFIKCWPVKMKTCVFPIVAGALVISGSFSDWLVLWRVWFQRDEPALLWLLFS